MTRHRTISRRWRFRLAAVCCGIMPFVIFELLCRSFGWGAIDTSVDPFVGFDGTRPLFVQSSDGRTMVTAENRRGYFKRDTFAAQKPDDEFRVFVFGGSTVQGNPFSIETSFPTYLQVALEQAAPKRRWRVVNCGGVSYSSSRLLPIMHECLDYEPDLFIFCEGHNEFLEVVEYAKTLHDPLFVRELTKHAATLHSFRLLQSGIASWNAPSIEVPDEIGARPLLPMEVDALLDHDGGLAAYHRDDVHSAIVAGHFRSNLLRMSEACRAHNVPLIFVLPPSNLADCPPFKSEFSDGASEASQAKIWECLRIAANSEAIDVPPNHEFKGYSAAQNLENQLQAAEEAVRLDPRYALSWYLLGQVQMSNRKYAEAHDAFRRARDEDVCPLRMTAKLASQIREVAESTGHPLIDAHALLEADCRFQIADDSVLVDHVHPSFRGHETIAIAIVECMLSLNLLTVKNSDWTTMTRAECAERLQELDDLYFLRGRRALESLKLWAAGRSGGPALLHRELTR